MMLGDRNDVEILLRKMNIFILPSLYEGFPISIIEAMSSKLPVIATNVDGIPEIIENGKTGILITPKNSTSIENAIISLIQNEELRKQLGDNGRKFVKNRFSKNLMVESHEKLFKDILA
jgi:glycosyltransferase involved in cell wall biosynthesis